jgi:hypothetical protein
LAGADSGNVLDSSFSDGWKFKSDKRYRGIEYEWAEWIKKFEALLKAMYWQSAVVHLETELTGLHTFTWETVDKNHIPGSDDFNIRCEWNHELGLVESTA